jgi:hypothetical protein
MVSPTLDYTVILLLALFSNLQYLSFTDLVLWIEIRTLDILLLMNIVILLTLNILRVPKFKYLGEYKYYSIYILFSGYSIK